MTVFERDDAPGGLLRYGIPDFKLEKPLVDRRIEQLEAEGVEFDCGVECGVDLDADELRARLRRGRAGDRRPAATATSTLPGRELAGVELAMPYLIAPQPRASRGLDRSAPRARPPGKRVAILGGGDTSADCLGNALREGAPSVIEIAHGPTPPRERDPLRTWPEWPTLLRSYAGARGGRRAPRGSSRRSRSRARRHVARCARSASSTRLGASRARGAACPSRTSTLDVDLVLIAIGFAGVEPSDGLADGLGVGVDARGTIETDGGSRPASTACSRGDCVRGADLIVTAIADGRRAAAAVERALARAATPG